MIQRFIFSSLTAIAYLGSFLPQAQAKILDPTKCDLRTEDCGSSKWNQSFLSAVKNSLSAADVINKLSDKEFFIADQSLLKITDHTKGAHFASSVYPRIVLWSLDRDFFITSPMKDAGNASSHLEVAFLDPVGSEISYQFLQIAYKDSKINVYTETKETKATKCQGCHIHYQPLSLAPSVNYSLTQPGFDKMTVSFLKALENTTGTVSTANFGKDVIASVEAFFPEYKLPSKQMGGSWPDGPGEQGSSYYARIFEVNAQLLKNRLQTQRNSKISNYSKPHNDLIKVLAPERNIFQNLANRKPSARLPLLDILNNHFDNKRLEKKFKAPGAFTDYKKFVWTAFRLSCDLTEKLFPIDNLIANALEIRNDNFENQFDSKIFQNNLEANLGPKKTAKESMKHFFFLQYLLEMPEITTLGSKIKAEEKALEGAFSRYLSEMPNPTTFTLNPADRKLTYLIYIDRFLKVYY